MRFSSSSSDPVPQSMFGFISVVTVIRSLPVWGAGAGSVDALLL